jgi:hypothetical protein
MGGKTGECLDPIALHENAAGGASCVTVTAEPPSFSPGRHRTRHRRGRHCVYHIAFGELVAATDAAGKAEQKKVLDELITQNRLEDFIRLSAVLAV